MVRAFVMSVALTLGATWAEEPSVPPFDYEGFQQRSNDAVWLSVYDGVAWRTSDLVMKEPPEVIERLGSEWFCLEIEDTWHAVFGSYDAQADRFEPLLHYVETEDGFTRASQPLDPELLTPVARGLSRAGARVTPRLREAGIRFNQYVRRLSDERLEVWYIAAWQPDGRFFHGSEMRFVLDAEGKTIEESFMPELGLRSIELEPDSRLIIPNDEADLPSVGQVFAVMLARNNAALAAVRNRDYYSVYWRPEGADFPVWIHLSREQADDETIESTLQALSRVIIEDQREEP